MVELAEGYYIEPLCRERGMTQGDPLLPNIFNMVVEAVVHHWEYLVSEEGGSYGRDNISGNEASQPER